MIQDADFSLEAANRRSKFWVSAQHAGERSFTTRIQEGVLTVTKTGSQPWFVIRQTLQTPNLSGQKMVFSADVKLDLQPPQLIHGLGDGGWLRVTARSANKKVLMQSALDQEPHIGKTDWERVQVLVELPSDTMQIDLSFLHQADGVMSIRNPFFGPVAAVSEVCGKSGVVAQ